MKLCGSFNAPIKLSLIDGRRAFEERLVCRPVNDITIKQRKDSKETFFLLILNHNLSV